MNTPKDPRPHQGNSLLLRIIRAAEILAQVKETSSAVPAAKRDEKHNRRVLQ